MRQRKALWYSASARAWCTTTAKSRVVCCRTGLGSICGLALCLVVTLGQRYCCREEYISAVQFQEAMTQAQLVTGLAAAEACGLALGYVLHKRASEAADADLKNLKAMHGHLLDLISLSDEVRKKSPNDDDDVDENLCRGLREYVYLLAEDVLEQADQAVFAHYGGKNLDEQHAILEKKMPGASMVLKMYKKIGVHYSVHNSYVAKATVDVPELCTLSRKYFNAVHYHNGTPQEKLDAKLSSAALLVQFLMVTFWQLVHYSEVKHPGTNNDGSSIQFVQRNRYDKRFTDVMYHNWFAEIVYTA